MRSIIATLLLGSLATFGLSLVGFWGISKLLEPSIVEQTKYLFRMFEMIEDDACRAYEEGGPPRLAKKLRRIDDHVPGIHFLTDAKGRDLATGVDRSNLLAREFDSANPLQLLGGRLVLVGRPRGGRYRFISIVPPWPEHAAIWPYYGVIALVIALMGGAVALNLAIPLRRLRCMVDRFGRGELSARSRSTRHDEIGELARSFDIMADRIETLLTAQRRLLQDVSHELRSPLARLRFAVELARTSDDRDAATERIHRDVGRLSMLVDELLQLTRAEGDETARRLGPVRLDDLLRSVVEDCELEAEAGGEFLHLRITGPCEVQGESELLRRAIENVLRNAIRYAPPGTAIEVDLCSSARSAKITIRDFGPGVPADSLKAIFEPFYRVFDDQSQPSGGAGLGLSIVRRAFALHGGTIAAENASPGLRIAMDLPRSH